MNLNEVKCKINRDTPIPLFFQVKRIILSEVAAGRLNQGDKLPSETEFSEQLGLSRSTVRMALNELVEEGLLVRKKKSGTFVEQPKLEITADISIEHLKKYADDMSRECSIEILELCEMDAIGEVNQALNLSQNEPLIYLKRLWRTDNVPIVYTATYFSRSRFSKMLDKDFTEINLNDMLKINYDLTISHSTKKISSILANKNDIDLLEINNTRAPLLYINEIMYCEKKQPVAYSVVRYRGDKIAVSI